MQKNHNATSVGFLRCLNSIFPESQSLDYINQVRGQHVSFWRTNFDKFFGDIASCNGFSLYGISATFKPNFRLPTDCVTSIKAPDKSVSLFQLSYHRLSVLQHYADKANVPKVAKIQVFAPINQD